MRQPLFHRTRPALSLPAPRFILLAVLVAALALGFCGNRVASPVRSAWREALRPGLQAMTSLDDLVDRWHENLLAAPQRELEACAPTSRSATNNCASAIYNSNSPTAISPMLLTSPAILPTQVKAARRRISLRCSTAELFPPACLGNNHNLSSRDRI